MNELELQKGKYTLKTLAEWFNISYSTIRKQREKYLNLLQEYAKFEITQNGKVEILQVNIPVYIKPDSTFEKIKNTVPSYWNKNGLDKKKYVTQKLYSKEELKIKFNTAYSYVCKATNELWGKPNSQISGSRGFCRWVLCVRDLNLNQLRYFTEEEEQKRQQFREEYFLNKTQEKLEKKEVREALRLQFKKKEISEEDYKEELFHLENTENSYYDQYFEALQNILPENCILDYGILVDDNYGFFTKKTNINFEF